MAVPEDEVKVMALEAETTIDPDAPKKPHPPVRTMLKLNAPETLGVPLMVTTFPEKLPETPAGRPLNVAPVAPVVAYVMSVMAVLMHNVWTLVPTAELSAIVLFVLIVIFTGDGVPMVVGEVPTILTL